MSHPRVRERRVILDGTVLRTPAVRRSLRTSATFLSEHFELSALTGSISVAPLRKVTGGFFATGALPSSNITMTAPLAPLAAAAAYLDSPLLLAAAGLLCAAFTIFAAPLSNEVETMRDLGRQLASGTAGVNEAMSAQKLVGGNQLDYTGVMNNEAVISFERTLGAIWALRPSQMRSVLSFAMGRAGIGEKAFADLINAITVIFRHPFTLIQTGENFVVQKNNYGIDEVADRTGTDNPWEALMLLPPGNLLVEGTQLSPTAIAAHFPGWKTATAGLNAAFIENLTAATLKGLSGRLLTGAVVIGTFPAGESGRFAEIQKIDGYEVRSKNGAQQTVVVARKLAKIMPARPEVPARQHLPSPQDAVDHANTIADLQMPTAAGDMAVATTQTLSPQQLARSFLKTTIPSINDLTAIGIEIIKGKAVATSTGSNWRAAEEMFKQLSFRGQEDLSRLLTQELFNQLGATLVAAALIGLNRATNRFYILYFCENERNLKITHMPQFETILFLNSFQDALLRFEEQRTPESAEKAADSALEMTKHAPLTQFILLMAFQHSFREKLAALLGGVGAASGRFRVAKEKGMFYIVPL